MSSQTRVRDNPLFANATSALVGTATVAALVAMEVADGAVRRAAGDQVHDDDTARLFGAAMAVALGTAGASLARPNRRPLPRNGAWFWIGTGLTWAGIGLNRWARRSLPPNYRALLTVVEDHEVVAHGPYRVVRHPMYLGSTMICAGVASALGTWSGAAAWALPAAALVHRVTVEERMLAKALGSRYEQYAATRCRMFPAISADSCCCRSSYRCTSGRRGGPVPSAGSCGRQGPSSPLSWSAGRLPTSRSGRRSPRSGCFRSPLRWPGRQPCRD